MATLYIYMNMYTISPSNKAMQLEGNYTQEQLLFFWRKYELPQARSNLTSYMTCTCTFNQGQPVVLLEPKQFVNV